MDRQTFLAAAAKAVEIKLRCDATFATLRELGEAARVTKRRMQALDNQLSQLKAHPAMRGSAPAREEVEHQLFMVDRDRTEAANEYAIAQRIVGELEAEAQRLARQRDSTAEQIKTWRKELDAIERKPAPSCILPVVGPISFPHTRVQGA